MLILIKVLSLKSGAFAGVHDCISGPPPFFFYSVIMSDGLFMPAEEVSLEGKRGSRISQTARGVIWRFEAALTATQAKPRNMASNLAFEDVIWSRSVVTATPFGTKWGINGVPNGPLRTFWGGVAVSMMQSAFQKYSKTFQAAGKAPQSRCTLMGFQMCSCFQGQETGFHNLLSVTQGQREPPPPTFQQMPIQQTFGTTCPVLLLSS